MATSPSKLLQESAAPFDSACMQVRHLEDYSIRIVEGRTEGRLLDDERTLFHLLQEYELVGIVDGVIRRI